MAYFWKNIAWDKSYNNKWYYNGQTTSIEECFLNVFNIQFQLEGSSTTHFYAWTDNNIPYIEIHNGRTIVLTLPYEADKIRFRKSGSDNNEMVEVDVENKVAKISTPDATTIWFGEIGIAKEIPYYYGFQQGGYDLYYNKGDTNIITTEYDTNSNPKPVKQILKSSTWSSVVSVPNYGIEGKSLHGVDSINWTNNKKKIFKYTTAYDNKTLTPYVWELVDRHAFICYSNFDGSDNWGATNSFSSGGYAEQPYHITGRIAGGRDKVEKSSGEWWEGASYSQITSSETDYEQTHDYFTGTHYVWMSKTQFTKQAKKIQTYEESETILILRYDKTTNQLEIKKNNDIYTYSLNNYKKILLAKRDLVSLQWMLDTTKNPRFMMCYADSAGSAAPSSRIAHILALHSDRVPQNPSYLFYRASVTNKVEQDGKEYRIGLADSAGYFDFATATDFSEATYIEGAIEQTIDVNLPEIEYFDITSLLQEKQELAFPRDLNLLPTETYTNIRRTDIEHIWDPIEYVFDFNKKPSTIDDKSFSYYWHGGVKYTIKINNIKTLGIPQVQSSIIEHIQNIQTANLEYLIYNDPTKSTISSSVLVQDYFSWTNVPNWFTEHFINFGCNEFCIARSAVSDSCVYQYVQFAKNKSNVTQVLDWNHDSFTCTVNVTGWADWQYNNLVPASTALPYGNDDYTKNPTWYAHCVKYWSPYDEDVPLDLNNMTGRGLQLGLTAGIAINYPDINSVDPTDYRIIDNKMPSIGILISK